MTTEQMTTQLWEYARALSDENVALINTRQADKAYCISKDVKELVDKLREFNESNALTSDAILKIRLAEIRKDSIDSLFFLLWLLALMALVWLMYTY